MLGSPEQRAGLTELQQGIFGTYKGGIISCTPSSWPPTSFYSVCGSDSILMVVNDDSFLLPGGLDKGQAGCLMALQAEIGTWFWDLDSSHTQDAHIVISFLVSVKATGLTKSNFIRHLKLGESLDNVKANFSAYGQFANMFRSESYCYLTLAFNNFWS